MTLSVSAKRVEERYQVSHMSISNRVVKTFRFHLLLLKMSMAFRQNTQASEFTVPAYAPLDTLLRVALAFALAVFLALASSLDSPQNVGLSSKPVAFVFFLVQAGDKKCLSQLNVGSIITFIAFMSPIPGCDRRRRYS